MPQGRIPGIDDPSGAVARHWSALGIADPSGSVARHWSALGSADPSGSIVGEGDASGFAANHSALRPGRVLGIDAGERRIGVALSDELRLLATPLVVLDRGHGLAPVLAALAEVARAEGVAQLVVGLPLNADGTHGRQARRAEDFARVAQRVLGVPAEMWDERLSTRAAEDIARAQGRNMRRLRQSGQLDAIAAAVILQDYLDHSGGGSHCADPTPEALCPPPDSRQSPNGTRPPAPDSRQSHSDTRPSPPDSRQSRHRNRKLSPER